MTCIKVAEAVVLSGGPMILVSSSLLGHEDKKNIKLETIDLGINIKSILLSSKIRNNVYVLSAILLL